MGEYYQRIADGTITEVLADHQVKAGDVFYLPAGRVHAICGGILLAEVQQSSDVTYRIFDYNRPGLDGKPRELHTALAAKALDFHVEAKYRTDYPEMAKNLDGNNACIVQAGSTGAILGELNVKFDKEGNVIKCEGAPQIIISSLQTANAEELEPKKKEAAMKILLLLMIFVIPRDRSGNRSCLESFPGAGR